VDKTKRQPTRWPNVVRYPDGTYYAFIKPMHGGPSKEVSLRTKKAMQVPDALKIAELKVQRSLYSGSRLTLEQSIDDCLEEKKRDWKPRTYIENKKIANNYLKKYLGHYKLTEIDHNVWAEFVKKKVVGDYMNCRYVLRGFLGWAMEKNWLPVMPLQFRLPKRKRRPRRILKPAEITAIVKVVSGKLEIFVHLCLFHGLRGNSEATPRQYTDINFENASLLIPDSKTGIARAIPLLHFTLQLIERDQRVAKSRFIFPNQANRAKFASAGWHRKSWRTALKKAGLIDAEGEPQDITPHDLRATGEKYAAKLTTFTRTEREKMFGSSVDIQDSTYLTEFYAEELRGMEAAMLHDQKGVEGLEKILESKALALGQVWDDRSENDRLQ
jgi:integrase